MTKSATKFKQDPKEAPVKTDAELLVVIEAAEAEKAKQDKIIKMSKALLLQSKHDEIQALLKAKDEPYGSVDLIVGNHKVQVTVKKDVKWDQKGLESLWTRISDDGQNPKNFIKVEYDVSETMWKSWDTDMQDAFRDARTVQPGTATIKIVKEE